MTILQLIALIEANVTSNGNRENTGQRVREALIEMAEFSDKVNFYDTFADFPPTGVADMLYINKATTSIYSWDAVLNTYVLFNDPDVINPDAPNEAQTFFARLATVAALQPVTYNNGTAGVGATLTSNTNIVLSQINTTAIIDQTLPAVGNIILIKNQASTIQNGLYEVTQLGTVGVAPFILTRVDGYDETSEVYPSIVFVTDGLSNINRYFSQNTVNPVIGTNGLVFGIAASNKPTLPLMLTDTYLDNINVLSARTYSNGTIYPTTLPGYGATLSAQANGVLGTINGVPMTSGKSILINDPTQPVINGDYTVTNTGSATQRWQLTRRNYTSSGFIYSTREWLISNVLSTMYGSRFSVDSTVTIINANIGSTQQINFNKQNNVGLRDTADNVLISDGGGLNLLNIDSVNNTINLSSSGGPNNSFVLLDGGTTHKAKLFSTGDVELIADNNIYIKADNGINNGFLRIEAGSNGVNLQHDSYVTIGNDNGNNGIEMDGTDLSMYASGNGTIFLNDKHGIRISPQRAVGNGMILSILSLPTYANDAAAGVGGLVTNMVYKTATGELRIKL